MPTLYVTAPPAVGAELASDLVEERLAACVNRVDCHSTYRWEGEVHADDEVILLVETTEGTVDRCREWIAEHHPCDVPCIERFEETVLEPAFGEWRSDAVQ